jgi:hypothetical protein
MGEKKEIITFSIAPFEIGTEKEAALKPLEEAAEVFGAWQTMERIDPVPEYSKEAVVYECCDVVQAVTNLLSRMGVSQKCVDKQMGLVTAHNYARGRYGKRGE